MRILANHTHLNVLETGSGPLTLVFLHYFGGSAREWQGVVDQLAGRFRCVAIDLRGHGESDAPETGYAVDNMADDVMTVLRKLNISEFVLVGHSMGGKVALAVAAVQPAGLQLLVLVSPSPPVPEPIPDADRQSLLDSYGNQSATVQKVQKITNMPLSETAQAQIIADDLRTAKPAWDAWLLAGSREDISARMERVTVPVRIIVGSDDHALPPDVQPRLVLPYLKNATLTTLAGAGHLLPWEVPEALAVFIADAIAGSESG
jgi:pimeloyl-ACP methyl ester carboxylesterase